MASIIVAVIAYIGNRKGAAEGIRQSNQMVEYRLKQLEEKVAKHNSVVERTYKLEEKVDVANHRIDDLEEFQKEAEEIRFEH
ncbi:MAG: hypothetical protein E7572_03810 [Ruminococcaceae bacterium]|nr:hypothetical protein [Oscillospiraceae bacterium]